MNNITALACIVIALSLVASSCTKTNTARTSQQNPPPTVVLPNNNVEPSTQNSAQQNPGEQVPAPLVQPAIKSPAEVL